MSSEMEAVAVRIAGWDKAAVIPREPDKPCDRRTVFKTIVPPTAPDNILPHAPDRIRYVIRNIGVVGTNGNVILASSSADASSALTAGTTQSLPGFVLPPGAEVKGIGTTEVWAVYAGGLTPGQLSIMAEYK